MSMRVANKLTLPPSSAVPRLSEEAVDDIADASTAAYQGDDASARLFHTESPLLVKGQRRKVVGGSKGRRQLESAREQL